MNRRGFLGMLGLGASALVMDPEALLWVPGKKTIFIPESASRIEFFEFEIPPGTLDRINALTSQFFRYKYWTLDLNRTYDGGTSIQDVLR